MLPLPAFTMAYALAAVHAVVPPDCPSCLDFVDDAVCVDQADACIAMLSALYYRPCLLGELFGRKQSTGGDRAGVISANEVVRGRDPATSATPVRGRSPSRLSAPRARPTW